MDSPELSRTRMAVAAGFFLQGLVFAAILTQIPGIQDKIGLGDGDVTLISLIVAVLAGLGSVVAGLIAERRSSATAFGLALLTISLGALLIGLAPNKPTILLAFALYGVGVGGVDAGMNMQGVWVQSAYGRSIMANFHGVWSVAGIVGALYAAGVARLDIPLTWSLSVVALVALVVTLAARPHFIDSREVAIDLGDSATPWRPILIIGVAVLVFYACDTGILAWSSKYLHDALDATKAVAPLAFAAYETGALISRFGGDFLVRRHGAVYVVRTGALIGIAGLLGVVVAPVPTLAIIGFFFAGLGLAILAPLAFAAIGGAVGPDRVDVAIARLNIANYLGAILGSGLIGAAATGGQLRWAFVIPLALIPIVLIVAKA
ncbi:MAG: MFS transporter, partial [Aeromicrobium sp.]